MGETAPICTCFSLMTDDNASDVSDRVEPGDVSNSSPVSASRWWSSSTWMAWGRLLRMRLRWWTTGHLIALAFATIVFGVSLWVIARELRGFEYAEVWAYLQQLPSSYVVLALGLTGLTFVVLTGYDALSLRYVGVRLSRRRILFSAFIGYAVSQAVGNPILTGGSVRYRLYTLWGFSASEVAKTILFAGISFWLGFFTLGGGLFLVEPTVLAESLDLPVSSVLLGLLCFAPVGLYAGGTYFRTEPFQLWGVTLDVPAWWMLPIQIALAAADLFLASSVVFVLLPPEAGISFAQLMIAYLIALLAGLVSHVPGGLGVFESIMLLILTPEVSPPVVLGALLAYRGIFHLVPLLIAALAFGGYELRRSVRKLVC